MSVTLITFTLRVQCGPLNWAMSQDIPVVDPAEDREQVKTTVEGGR
jgi:hypothetical protein